MKHITKQATGFRLSQHSFTVLNEIGSVTHNERKYKLVDVKTEDGLRYYSLRLYNKNGKFIKQFLFEPGILQGLLNLMLDAALKELKDDKRYYEKGFPIRLDEGDLP